MPQIELTIRLSDSRPLEPAAWYLPGDAPFLWLEEIASWPIDHLAIRLIAIRDTDGTGIAGVIAVPATTTFAPSGHCIALGRLGENLYLPVDAELFPTPPQDEIQQLLSDDYIYAWLPGRGLTTAEPDEVLEIADLIALPDDAMIDWSQAVQGVAFPNRLLAILPDSPPSFEDIIGEGRNGIGERAGEIPQLPKSPHEPFSGVAGAALRAALMGVALPVLGVGKILSALGNMIPTGAMGGHGQPRRSAAGSVVGGESGLGRLANFANNLLQKVDKSLEAERHKEVGRLLHMLDSDPDQGLKFAIPLGGAQGAHRGLRAPGGQLHRRNVDFSLSRLGGGGPADIWDMSHDYQQELITKYRELAARETRLGRYRRAAYIYAELLGDLRSAASTLEQGRHFREAAVLYRDKIQDAQAAAGCLERGELWNEAIEAYRDLGRHEKVGDLLAHIDQPEAAAAAYHAAADELKGKQDLLGASRIYEQKLDDYRQALETLDGGWPNTPQAGRCVAASFEMRGRLAYHQDARQRAAELYADAEPLGMHADVASMLADVCDKYPDAQVQQESRKLSKNLIANRLRDASTSEADRLVSVLARLESNDRLLRRDGRRYVDSQRALEPKRPIAATPKDRMHVTKHVDLGLKGVWHSAVSVGDVIIAAGVMDGRIVFARCHQDGRVDRNRTPWPKISISSHARVVLHASQTGVRIFAIGEQSLPETTIFPSSIPSTSAITAGTPRGLDVVWGAALGKTGHTWAIANRDDPVLVCVDAKGAVVSTKSLLSAADAPWENVAHPVPIHAAGNEVVIAVADQLLRMKNGQVEVFEQLPSRVIGLGGGSPYAAPILTASMETGVAIIRLGMEGYTKTVFAELTTPRAWLNQGGFLIAADSSAVQSQSYKSLKKSNTQQLKVKGDKHDTGKPIAILPARHSSGFILVTETGVVSYYEIRS